MSGPTTPVRPHSWISRHGVDVVLALLLGAGVALGARRLERAIGPGIVEPENINLWYQSDAPRIHENLTLSVSDHYRSAVHPVFSLVSIAPVRALEHLANIPPEVGLDLVLWAEAFAWMVTLYVLLRVVGLRALDATVFAIAGAVSGAAILWLPVAETYALGSMTMMLALIVTARFARGRPSDAALVTTAAVTLTITLTNFMAGVLLVLGQRPPRRAAHLLVLAFAAVSVLWGVQKAFVPSSQYFLGIRSESRYIVHPDLARFTQTLTGFVAHAAVLPIPTPTGEDGALTVQEAPLDPGTLPGRVALVAWLALLALGIAGLVHAKPHWRFLLVLFGTLAGQFVLHVFYGEEVVLYALHWLPFMVVIAGHSTFGRWRVPALALAVVFVGGTMAQDARVLARSTSAVRDRTTPRRLVLGEMALRPRDPWPRGSGHIVLGLPGSPDSLKAYAEPGGSFSPAVRSFGLSVWVLGRNGEPARTSDDLPLSLLRQSFVADPSSPLPILRETTLHYTLEWRLEAPGTWLCMLRAQHQPLALVLRGVGPAAGPVTRLAREGATLRVGDRWRVETADGGATPWALVSEHDRRWRTRAPGPDSIGDPSGWAAARLRVEAESTRVLRIVDTAPQAATPLAPLPLSEGVKCEGGNASFRACLDAQLTQLSMGITDDGLRPADPLEYAFPWARDEAYGVVALARAGHHPMAAWLAEDFISRDFFGGFGSEADAPGLGIWALAEVALTGHDAAYEARIAPAVERKARLLERMLTVPDTLWAPVEGLLLPDARRDWRATMPALPARDGLITGRMDRHEPTLYVNATAYLGLRDAATLAARRGDPAGAARWGALADSLREAWERRFDQAEDDNERTWTASLWPSRVAERRREGYREGLQHRWRAQRDSRGNFRHAPLYSYFALGEAHQWLALGESDRAWATLHAFWASQSSPGLYTWREGRGEEHPSGAWRRVRGWVAPGTVTPHYWSAAEMALLQLDMLASERNDARGTIVIGAGLPHDWLAKPFSVRGITLRGAALEWSWDGTRVTVRFEGPPHPVELGEGFPGYTPLVVTRASAR